MSILLPLPISDGALVRRVLGEDPQASELLVFRYQRKASAVARALGVRGDAVDDVVQEALFRAFSHLPELRATESFGPWFLSIVRNAARQHLRGEGKVAFTPLLDLKEAAPKESLEARELKEHLWRKVEELPEGIREAIFLYYHEGESARAVARALGISGTALKSRLKRGRDFLKEDLWREIGDNLRDLLPSARDGRKSARKLALLLLAASPAVWRSAAHAAAFLANAAPAALAPLSALSSFEPLKIGGLIVSGKKLLVSLVLSAVLILTGTILVIAPSGWIRRGGTSLPPAGRAVSAGSNLEKGKTAASREESLPEARADRSKASLASSPVSLAGTIRGDEGTPVRGARVWALETAAWASVAAEHEKDSPSRRADPARKILALKAAYLERAKAVPQARSSLDGAYEFRGLKEGEHRVIVLHPDFLPSLRSRVAISSAAARCDIELEPGRSISGTVAGTDGNPLAGAVVEAETAARAALKGDERIDRLAADWADGAILLDGEGARTGPVGAFRLGSLPPERHDLIARMEGWLEGRAWQVPAGATGITLTLSRGFVLTGRILDPKGGGVGGATSALKLARTLEVHKLFDGRQADIDLYRGEPEATSDGEGRFRMEGLEESTYELVVRAEGFPLLRKEIVLSGDVDAGDLVLEERRSITGTVHASDGHPLPGARVWVERPARKVTPSNWLVLAPAEPLSETTSGEGGEFVLANLPAGSFDVRGESDEHGEGLSSGVPAGETGVSVVLRAGIAIRGRVVDDETSAPVPGARVKVGFAKEKTAVSDASGAFEIRCLSLSALHNGMTSIWAEHPDFGSYSDYNVMVLGRGETSALEIRLSRGERLRGLASDSRGLAVQGALVEIEVVGLPAEAMGYNPAKGVKAVTGQDGSFTLDAPRQLRFSMGRIRFQVRASHPSAGVGRTPLFDLPATGEAWPEANVTLLPGSSLEGKITGADGSPIEGARILLARAVDEKTGADLSAALAAGRAVYSRRDGSYRMQGLEPGASEIEISALGWEARRIAGFEVEAGSMKADFVLGAGEALQGKVVDSAGDPLPGVEVVAFRERGELDDRAGDGGEFTKRMERLRAQGEATARTGTDGRYRLEHLGAGSYRLVARADGYEAAEASRLKPGQEAPPLVLSRFGAILGTVLDKESRRPVGSFQVDVINRQTRKAYNAFDYRIGTEGELRYSDPDGQFVYDGLRAGDYEVIVKSEGRVPFQTNVILKAGEELPLEALLEKGGTIEGAVLDAETGLPVVGAMISCFRPSAKPGYSVSMGPSGEVRSGEDGSFSVSGLADGKYSLSAFHPFYRRGNGVEVEIQGGGNGRAELRLPPGGRIEGRLRGLPGNQLGKRAVSFSLDLGKVGEQGEKPEGAPVGSWMPVYMSPDGSFHADCLEPGTYRVTLKKQEMERAEMTHLGPMGGFSATKPVGPEEKTPLGEVEVEPRRTAIFNAKVR
jgi:RNA polymerase sigma factor (sigma-70 family)